MLPQQQCPSLHTIHVYVANPSFYSFGGIRQKANPKDGWKFSHIGKGQLVSWKDTKKGNVISKVLTVPAFVDFNWISVWFLSRRCFFWKIWTQVEEIEECLFFFRWVVQPPNSGLFSLNSPFSSSSWTFSKTKLDVVSSGENRGCCLWGLVDMLQRSDDVKFLGQMAKHFGLCKSWGFSYIFWLCIYIYIYCHFWYMYIMSYIVMHC